VPNAYRRLVFTGEPCEMAEVCKNSPRNTAQTLARCSGCRWSPEEPDGKDCYKPKDKYAVFSRREEAERKEAKERLVARREQRGQKDRSRVLINRRAERAERKTERNIIKATVNSGRSNNDGDHISNGSIVLDTKMQSTREHPVVKLDELAKVRLQARRAGYAIGALVLRNKNNFGVVCLAEEDYARLISGRGNHEQTSESGSGEGAVETLSATVSSVTGSPVQSGS
jgi:hypothetical protein